MSAATTISATVHEGSLATIPASASPGLTFLRSFLPVLDSLDPSSDISTFCSPSATFAINRSPAVPVTRVMEMLQMRSEKLQTFGHDLKRAWDIPSEDGRTLIWESISVTRFKVDNVDVLVNEMSVWEIQDIEGEWKLVRAES